MEVFAHELFMTIRVLAFLAVFCVVAFLFLRD